MRIDHYYHSADQNDAQFAALRAELQALVSSIKGLVEGINTMSQSLSDQLDAVTQAIRDDVANISAEVGRLLGGMVAGNQIQQSQVDALTAIDASLKAIPSDQPAATPVVDPAAGAPPSDATL